MRFDLKLNEIQYIQKKFHYDNLIGIEKRLLPNIGAEKSLREKGVIKDFSSNLELESEYRYLFSSWAKMRYSIICPEENLANSFFCVLANQKEIIILEQVGNDFVIEIVDFSEEIMDRVIRNMAKINDCEVSDKSFNIVMSVSDFVEFSSSKSDADFNAWSRKLGIDKDVLASYVVTVNKENEYSLLLCEDHEEESGALTKIAYGPKGICALKHITPNDASRERVVMILGDAQRIIDSIYVI